MPGALETGRKHLLWGRPDIPVTARCTFWFPSSPPSPRSWLLAAYFLQLTSGVHSP